MVVLLFVWYFSATSVALSLYSFDFISVFFIFATNRKNTLELSLILNDVETWSVQTSHTILGRKTESLMKTTYVNV